MRIARTDLAMEACARAGRPVSGIKTETTQLKDYSVTSVVIRSQQASEELGRPMGSYITLECPGLANAEAGLRERAADELCRRLRPFLPETGDVLVIGLGNRHITADALGARVVEQTLITRHLKENVQPALTGKLRGVCAAAPGVLGTTGMETAEIIQGIVEKVRPAAVIAVDALAAMACARIGTTIQLTDTGINPGSGVGNHRLGITRETLGVPVIALGVPMVVYAATLAGDAIEQYFGQTGIDRRQAERLNELIAEKLQQETLGELVVTPREIDEMVEHLAQILAMGLNKALQPRLSIEEIAWLMH